MTTSNAGAAVRTMPPVGSHPGAWFEPPAVDGIGRIVLDRPDDTVNAVNPALVEAIGLAVKRARADETLTGLLLVSAKPDQWIAGADLKLITAGGPPDQLEAMVRRYQSVCDELAWLPCTTVAVISGPALGGGFELALACDYRVAADTDSVTVGLPEVSLGLLPAGGGTQRLPRLIGLAPALDAILTGRRFTARHAKRTGLLDEVVHPSVLEEAGIAWAKKGKRSLDRPLRLAPTASAALDLAEQTPQGRQVMYSRAKAAIMARTHGLYPAPLKAIEAIRAGFEHGLAAGLEAEVRGFMEIARGPVARNLIGLFLATQAQKKRALPPDQMALGHPVARLGLVGAGFMGSGIAEVAAAAGIPVRLRDRDSDAVARGLANVRKLVDEGVAKHRFTRFEGADVRHRVSGTTYYSGFASTDLVIEAVFEDLPIKRQVVRDLEAVLRPDAVIASNTSALPIGEIAAHASHPERIVGMHFFSPAHRMPLLEVVRGADSADWAVATVVQLGIRMGKTVIVVRDGPGFFTTRVLGVMMNEAVNLLAEGAAMPEVDAALLAFGFPVGPFRLYDEVGLEVASHISDSLVLTGGERARSADVVAALVQQGSTGKRSGKGFYLWPERRASRLPIALPLPFLRPDDHPIPNPAALTALGDPPRRSFTSEAIQERLALLFVNEAVRCLEEGILQSPTDGDLGAVLGVGFPPFRGGPFRYLDDLGADAVRRSLEQLAVNHGPRYAPAGLLVEHAASGRPFYPPRQLPSVPQEDQARA